MAIIRNKTYYYINGSGENQNPIKLKNLPRCSLETTGRRFPRRQICFVYLDIIVRFYMICKYIVML